MEVTDKGDRMKIIIWGTGKVERSIEPYVKESVDIVAFVDNDEKSWDSCICIMRKNQYFEIPIISPQDLKHMEYDYIVIATAAWKEVMGQCIDVLKISKDKLLQAFESGLWKKKQIERIFDANIMSDRNDYYIGNRKVQMDENHALPQMQRELMMYDRFVPFLGKLTQKKSGKYIIDIGANIGDTVMAMWDYTDDKFLCIEPADVFLNMGKKNVEKLEEKNRVFFEKTFITDDVKTQYAPNVYRGGTAVKEKVRKGQDKEEIPSKSLDQLLTEKKVMFEELDLIKIDTDGFDADCIISGKNALRNGKALLYWENAIFNYEQYEKYQKAYELLEEAAYTAFFIFDNCGNYMCRTNIEGVRSLSAYLQRINAGWDRITFDYVDILGCKESDIEKCQQEISEYLKSYLLCRKKKRKE